MVEIISVVKSLVWGAISVGGNAPFSQNLSHIRISIISVGIKVLARVLGLGYGIRIRILVLVLGLGY